MAFLHKSVNDVALMNRYSYLEYKNDPISINGYKSAHMKTAGTTIIQMASSVQRTDILIC